MVQVGTVRGGVRAVRVAVRVFMASRQCGIAAGMGSNRRRPKMRPTFFGRAHEGSDRTRADAHRDNALSKSRDRGAAKVSLTPYIHGMRHEWDWPPTRRRFLAGFRARLDAPQPRGWSSPAANFAVRIYWRITIGIIKTLLAMMLTAVAIGAFWLLVTIIRL